MKLLDGAASARDAERGIEVELVALRAAFVGATDPFNRKRQPLAAYRFGGLECMLLGPGEGGLMSMIG